MHWAFNYLGIPWASGGNSEAEGFDCWTFFRFVQIQHYGRSMPVIEVPGYHPLTTNTLLRVHPERNRWTESSTPADGCAVLLGRGRAVTHIGVWLDIDGGGVLHCDRHKGVVFTKGNAIKDQGYATAEYYRFAN